MRWEVIGWDHPVVRLRGKWAAAGLDENALLLVFRVSDDWQSREEASWFSWETTWLVTIRAFPKRAFAFEPDGREYGLHGEFNMHIDGIKGVLIEGVTYGKIKALFDSIPGITMSWAKL